MKRNYIYLIALQVLLVGCSENGITPGAPDSGAVTFATEVSNDPATRATTGLINSLEELKKVNEGFGVFAYLTEGTPFATQFPPSGTEPASKDKTKYTSFSNFFMQNQRVTWGVQWVENANDEDPSNDISHKDWVYTPLKYWPNYTDNNNASPRYISFFAYAPWVDATTSPTAGIIDYTRSDDRTPHVIYRIGVADQQVDLLWANAIDARRNDNGLIAINGAALPGQELEYQKVPLRFKHALAAIDVYVQRVYDEPAYTGKTPKILAYPTLFVSKLELKSEAPAAGYNDLQKSGKLSLIDGTWEDDGTWKRAEDGPVTITYDEQQFNDTIRGTAQTTEDYIRDAELEKWKWVLDTKNTSDKSDDEWVDATAISAEDLAKPENANRWQNAYGASEDERNLLKNSMTQMMLPRKVTLKPTLTYSMVTRDDNLQVGYYTDGDGHRYSRIVNEVEGNSVTLDLVAGKRYTLLIRIGVEHISFELVNIVDWDFPMRYDPTVVPYSDEEVIGHIVNEE